MNNNQSPQKTEQALKPIPRATYKPDDRYPGSYFRIPGVPRLGKTTWALTQ